MYLVPFFSVCIRLLFLLDVAYKHMHNHGTIMASLEAKQQFHTVQSPTALWLCVLEALTQW